MADLQFVDFALMLIPTRKEKHFRLPDDFSNIDINYSLTDEGRTSHPASDFPAVFTTRTDRCSAIRKMSYTTREGEARNFKVSALRGRNRRLLAAVM